MWALEVEKTIQSPNILLSVDGMVNHVNHVEEVVSLEVNVIVVYRELEKLL